MVCSIKREPIPGEIRYQWVKKCFPEANVIHHYEEIPQEPKDHPDFWNIWKNTIEKHCPWREFDALFWSEDYGWKMAEVMWIQYIPVDRLRTLVPMSWTAMREDPMTNWKYLPNVVRPYFVKKLAIVWPEWSWKTALAKALSDYYQTIMIDQYSQRLFAEYEKNFSFNIADTSIEDIYTIARWQIVTEDIHAQYANRILVCDTDLNSICYFSKKLFWTVPGWMIHEADKRKYDLTILIQPNNKEQSEEYDFLEYELKRQWRAYIVVEEWNLDSQIEKWIDAVTRFIKYIPHHE